MKVKYLPIWLMAVVFSAGSQTVYGQAWRPMVSGTAVSLRSIWGTGSNDLFAVGEFGTILHYDGNPDNIWEKMSSGTDEHLVSVYGRGSNDVFAGGYGGTLLHYDGATWSPVLGLPIENIGVFCDIWVSDAHVFVLNADNPDSKTHILHSDGASWSHYVDGGPSGQTSVVRIWGRSPTDVYAGGYTVPSTHGIMYHYDGEDWTCFCSEPGRPGDLSLPDTTKLRGVGPSWGPAGSAELFLPGQAYKPEGGWAGVILRYYGDGWGRDDYDVAKWQVQLRPEVPGLGEIWGASTDDIYILGPGGLILHGGHDFSWSRMESGTTHQLMAVWGSGPRDVFAVGGYGTILRLQLNRPPVAECQDVEKAADKNCQAVVSPQEVDNGSYDPDGDPITLSLSPSGPYPLGETIVTLTVTDPSGASGRCMAMVTVLDQTPPEIISLSASPNVLWPANHKMVAVKVNVEATDNCDAALESRIVDVTCNEPVNGPGDGNTTPDWEVTGPRTVKLRAERAGAKEGRIYTIYVECRDAAGNWAIDTVDVTVPHDQGKNKRK